MRCKNNSPRLFTTFTFILAAFLIAGSWSPAFGEDTATKKDLPARSIAISAEYTGIVIKADDDISIDLTVANKGRQDEDIDVSLSSVPKGWDARIKTYSFDVTGVHVVSDSSKSLTLKAEPQDGLKPGTYTFRVLAQTRDKKLSSSSQITVTTTPKEPEKKVARGINIVTSYPVLKGPTDGKFEFSLEVENKLDKETIFNLTAQGPENWDINFKPAYEEKYISSIRSKEGQSQTVAVVVKPFALAEAGEYPIKVKVSSPEAEAEAELTIALTGTYKLDAGTANGLLSLNALKGKPANLSIYAKNTGSATMENVQLLSFKPENWKVEFTPENIETMAPGDFKQVEVTITPTDQALVGDYSVVLNVDAGKVSKTLELRVSVRASTAWAWIGIGIILLVLLGLVVLFIRLGRR
jgi:uncharacterized membrane protein